MPKALARVAPNKSKPPTGAKRGAKRNVSSTGAENNKAAAGAGRKLPLPGKRVPRKDTPRKVRQGVKLAMSKSKQAKASARAAFLAPDPLLEETTKVRRRGWVGAGG